ncbi:MAG TPA: hypothetical protein VFJ30_01235 [Phycisphaerae bacterium]|nr:hypothetical protein [Phycisphaerae bacterium]
MEHSTNMGSTGPLFESLEQRLMLTTLQAGEWFVYNGSQDKFILVTMAGNPGSKAEILALDHKTGDVNLMDISGMMGGPGWGPSPVFGGFSGLGNLDTIIGSPPYLDQQIVLGLARRPAQLPAQELYSFDNFLHQLWVVDALNGTRVPGSNRLITDSLQPFYGYTIDAMTVNAAGTIVAAGFLVDLDPMNLPPPPAVAGQYLINIDYATGMGTIVDPTAPLAVPGGTGRVTDMAYSGGQLYGIDGANIFTITDTTGQIGPPQTLVDVTNNNAPITGATGLEFFNGALYICDANTVYTVNPGNGNCTPLNGNLSQQDMTDLASDGTDLYGVFSSNATSILARIETNPPANVDPFAIYISQADMTTKLTFTEVGRVTINQVVTPAIPQMVPVGQVDIQLYQASQPPFISTGGARAPAGSGGVLIGGLHIPTQGLPNRHVATAITGPYGVATPFTPIGEFPGGVLHAGITVACPMATIIDGDLGQSVSALAADSAGTFYAVDNTTGNLIQIQYTPEVPASIGWPGDPMIPPIPSAPWSPDGGAPTITAMGVLTDASQPAWTYVNIQALEFDDTDTLYAIGMVVSSNPAIPAPTGLWLVTIDPTTGLVTPLAELDPEVSKYHGMVIDAGGTFTAIGTWVDPVTAKPTDNTLVGIDPVTGTLTQIGEVTFQGASLDLIEGLEYFGANLYATTGTMLYVLSGTAAIPLAETGLDELSDLAATSVLGPQGRFLWSVTYDEGYNLVKLDLLRPAQDMGKLAVAGVIAGGVHGSGSIDVIETGLLWGNVEIPYDLGRLVLHTDFAAGTGVRPDNALVRVNGTLGELDVYGNSYGSVSVGGKANIPHSDSHLSDLNVPVPRDPLISLVDVPIWWPVRELEWKPPDTDPLPETQWTDYANLMTVVNDTPDDFQFISNEFGEIAVWGDLAGPGNHNDVEDWWAISLMSGQTVRIDAVGALGVWTDPITGISDSPGWVTDPLDAAPFMYNGFALDVFDGTLNYLASVGYETIEDHGLQSRVTWPYTTGYQRHQEPLTFTAPEAGIYYVRVCASTAILWTDFCYTLFMDDLTARDKPEDDLTTALGKANAASLGAIHTLGDYDPSYGGTGTRTNMDIEVTGGSFGAFEVAGIAGPNGLFARVYGQGNMVSFRGGIIDLTLLQVDNNIGLVASTAGGAGITAVAGAGFAVVNTDAFIQNFNSAADTSVGLYATGGLGVVDVVGSVFSGSEFAINTDNITDHTVYCDLIHVGGDWGTAPLGSNPYLTHGENADFRYVDVEGDIYVRWGSYIGLMSPTQVDDGTISTIEDDGGGRVVLTPGAQIDPATGLPMTVTDPVTGAVTPVLTSYQYYVLPVQGTTGGVLCRVEATGDFTLSIPGAGDVVDVVHVNHMGNGQLNLGGVGTVNAYFVEGTGTTSVINGTKGDIVSGLFDTIDTIQTGGNIGRAVGDVGEWIRGREPTAPAPNNPQMGWLNRTIDGIHVTGDVNVVRAGGWLGDVFVEGHLDLAVANADNVTAPDSWDGVIGVIEADTIGTIRVGDGLADDGSGDRAMAAIIGRTSIDSVLIDGAGHVLNGAILTGGANPLPIGTPAIGRVIGTNGAVCTSLIMACDVETYQVYRSGVYPFTGGIGVVRFSGPGGAIRGAEIAGQWIDTVETTVETEGIDTSFISANLPLPNRPAITQILAGGPGMHRSVLSTNGGRFGAIRGIGPNADLTINYIRSTDGLDELKARDIVQNTILIPLQIDRFIATREIVGNYNVYVGSIGTLSTGADFAGNYFSIAANLNRAVIGGHYDHSVLDLQGPTTTQLGVLDVMGNISGEIRSTGRIGQIISRMGMISANITTMDDAVQADIGSITTRNGFTGELRVEGSVGRFTSYATLGTNPMLLPDMVPLQFKIAVDLDVLEVKGVKNGPALDLFTSLYVGGNVGKIDIDGSLYADVQVNGNLGRLVLDGDMGGQFVLVAPTILGDVTVLGTIGGLSLVDGANLVGDLTSGGSIGKIKLTDKAANPARGNILGVIRSLHGSIGSVTLTNGVLGGLEAATSIGKVILKGTAGDPAAITGDLIANGGGIGSLTIVNGNLDANVRALAGAIGKLSITGGNVVAGNVVYSSRGIGSLAIKGGNLDADVTTDGSLMKFSVAGDVNGQVSAAGKVENVSILGDLNGGLWAGTGIKSVNIRGHMTGATIGSMFDMDRISVSGNVTNSQIIGGYDPATGKVRGADLKTLSVGGNWTASVVALGVDPVDGSFFTLGDNVAAPGVSSLGVMSVGGIASPAGSLILADTCFGVVPVPLLGVASTVDGPTPPLSADPAHRFQAGRYVAADGLIITYNGNGQGSYDPATGQVVLQGAGAGHSLTLDMPGAAKTIHVTGDDDLGLSSLTFRNNAITGDMTIQGDIGKFATGAVADGSHWQLWDGAKSVATGGLNGVDVVAGAIGSWKLAGNFDRLAGDEGLTAYMIGKMDIAGNLTASIATIINGIGSLNVRGNITGGKMALGEEQIVTAGGIGRLSANSIIADPSAGQAVLSVNPATGGIHVLSGDLGSLTSNGDVNANITVDNGGIGQFSIRNGTYGNMVTDTAVRSLTGIGRFNVRGGNLYGIVSTDGPLGSLSVSDKGQGTLFGRVRAGDGIGSAQMDLMINALLSSATDVGRVSIRGDMTSSTIVAGIDPSDAGFDPAHGVEAANVQFDGRTTLPWRTPLNTDILGGGDVNQVNIGGNMIASAISAGVGAGANGWFGTWDDQVRGTGLVKRVKVRGSITGTVDPTEHYGLFAASGMPVYTANPTTVTGNVTIGTQSRGVGSPQINNVQVLTDRIVIYFAHDIDFGTITTGLLHPSRPSTLNLVVSHNSLFGPTESDDFSITDLQPHALSYDDLTHTLTIRLLGKTFVSLNKGTNYLLTLDGSVVSDRRGNLVDGEYNTAFPTGDGMAGGDFLYRFIHGDAGDTAATAIDLTGGVPILKPNKVLDLRGRIGDNDPRPANSDVDVYSVEVHMGDILYYETSWGIALDDGGGGILVTSLSTMGHRATADGVVMISVSGSPGPYTLSVLVFNDGNTNFTFDDATQTATPVIWKGDTAVLGPNDKPEDAITADIIAPDDYDIYELGFLPAFTEIHLGLDTRRIGSPMEGKMAVFNSNGDMIGNITSPYYDLEGHFPDGKLDPSVTLRQTALTPAADTYYVAIAGGWHQAGSFQQTDQGKYRLTITQSQGQAPVFRHQLVYLNFDGGVAEYLIDAFGATYAGIPTETYQSPLSADLFGYDAAQTQELINGIVATVEENYAAFGNISFTTVKPMGGQYSTVFVGSNLSPDGMTGGIADGINTNNSDLSDMVVVFGAEFAWAFGQPFGNTLDEVAVVLGNVASHELGHILGLNHVNNSTTLPDTWIMSYAHLPHMNTDDMVFTTHEHLMSDANVEFLIGYQNSVASLWSIA